MRYVSNPRRAPRVMARLRCEVLHRGLDFHAETEDFGPKGCLVVSPQPLDPGNWVRLMLEADPLPEKLRVAGRVAWASGPSHDRAGVAFAEMEVDHNQDPSIWFERLLRASPGLVPLMRHVPDRLHYDTPLYLLPPPRFIVDFSQAELDLIAGMRNGNTVEQLLQRIRPEKKNEGRLIFALLARRVLSLSATEACDPSAWRDLLEQASRSHEEPPEVVRLSSLEVGAELPPAPRAATPQVGSGQDQARDILPSWLTGTSPGWSARPGSQVIVPPPPERVSPGAASPTQKPPLTRAAPPDRSPQAHQHYEQGLARAASGDLTGAVNLLRKAQALAPRDREIARTLGQLERKAAAQ